MKVFAIVAVLVVCASAFEYTAEWEMWKKTQGKEYRSDEEELHRHIVWESNQEYVINHNKNAEKLGWTLEMNVFADLESSEFGAMYNGYAKAPRRNTTRYYVPIGKDQLPSTVDWTTKGAVTPVKNQKQCGSCWAFSTTGSLEGQTFLHKGNLPSLSEQQLVDCSDSFGNHGCQGGLMDNAFKYIKSNGGIDTESSYPYEAKNDKCRYKSADIAATVTGFVDIKDGDIAGLKTAVANIGPISVAMDASHSSFQLYAAGIYDPFLCSSTRLDHGVLAVGYGTGPSGIFHTETDYWLVKNSWGAVWGQKGYFKIVQKGNKCGIATSASYPLV